MINTLLASENVHVSFGLLGFFLGMAVVFLGIAILVLAVYLMGVIIKAIQNRKTMKKQPEIVVEQAAEPVAEGIPTEVKAAIVAAISAYYYNEKASACEFKLKNIKTNRR